MIREPWVHYNAEEDCYYSADGKICGTELAQAKLDWPPRSAISEGMESYNGRRAIRKLIKDLQFYRRKK